MNKKDLLPFLWEIFEPVVQSEGLSLYDVEYVKEGQEWYIRAYIDKDSGVTISDCEVINKKIDKLLDERDPVSHPYILEVSSPGVDRALKKEAHFLKHIGSIVDIKLFKARNGCKLFQGELLSYQDGIIKINDEKCGVLEFDQKDTASCKLAVFF